MRIVLCAVVLALSLPKAARAETDEAKKEAKLEEAREHVAKAKVHYDLGEFKEAAEEYILVYRLRPVETHGRLIALCGRGRPRPRS